MNFEKLPFSFDIEMLKEHFQHEVLPLPPVVRSAAIGGWSVQSSDGTYQDGWQNGFLPYNGPGNENPTWRPKSSEENQLKSMQDFSVPSNICFGALKKVMDQIENQGFRPRRARIIRLTAGTESVWHVDGSPHVYAVRLHIPIITNPLCRFEYENESQHLPADGSAYLVAVNRLHRVINGGLQDRYHLVMNVWDTMPVSQNFQFRPKAVISA